LLQMQHSKFLLHMAHIELDFLHQTFLLHMAHTPLFQLLRLW
jgi:hypothetical protein